MRKRLNLAALIVVCALAAVLLAGCEDDTVQKYVISNTAYDSFDAVDQAVQPDSLEAGKSVYANVYFIESPKGMQYEARWQIDGAEVLSEVKVMETEPKSVVVFELPGDKAVKGALNFKVLYKQKPVIDRNITIE